MKLKWYTSQYLDVNVCHQWSMNQDMTEFLSFLKLKKVDDLYKINLVVVNKEETCNNSFALSINLRQTIDVNRPDIVVKEKFVY